MGRIGNRVKVPDGTAAVSAEVMLFDESRSLGNWEGEHKRRRYNLHKRKSEDLLEMILPVMMVYHYSASNSLRKYGCSNPNGLLQPTCFFPGFRKNQIHKNPPEQAAHDFKIPDWISAPSGQLTLLNARVFI